MHGAFEIRGASKESFSAIVSQRILSMSVETIVHFYSHTRCRSSYTGRMPPSTTYPPAISRSRVHECSNHVMKLFHVCCEFFFSGRSFLHRFVVYLCYTPEQASLAKGFSHLLGYGYIDKGGTVSRCISSLVWHGQPSYSGRRRTHRPMVT